VLHYVIKKADWCVFVMGWNVYWG